MYIISIIVLWKPLMRVGRESQGRPSPLRPWCIFPLFQIFPYFRKIFGLWGNFSKFYFYPTNFLIFIRRHFWWPFFSHRPQISNLPPYFPCFNTFPPCFAKIILSSPTLTNFPHCFRQIHLLFTYFTCISFPPTVTMMHLCITQCTYWTPLGRVKSTKRNQA